MSEVWTIERHLEAGSDRGRALFHRFVDIVAACGEYTTSVAKTTITFKGPRRGFAGARPNGDRLQGYFDVTYRVDSPEQLDGEFGRWIADAYDQVGCGNR